MDSDPAPSPPASPGTGPDVKTILEDRRWGDSVEKRSATFTAARQWTGGLTVAGAAALILSLAYPHPHSLLMAILLILPLVALLQLVRFKGLVRFNGSLRTPYPDVLRPCFLPVAALLIRDFKDVRPPDWLALVIPIAGLTLILLAMLWVCARDVRAKASRLGLAALFAFTYAVGAMMHLNGLYEQFFH
jgi:hypothetical protein